MSLEMTFADGKRKFVFHLRPLLVPPSNDGLFSGQSVIRRVYSDSAVGYGAGTALLLQLDILNMLSRSTPVGYGVLVVLVCLSLISWAIIFAKWSTFRHAAASNTKFLRAFRKASGLDGVVVAVHHQVVHGDRSRHRLLFPRWRCPSLQEPAAGRTLPA